MPSKRLTEQKYEHNEEDGISKSNIIVFAVGMARFPPIFFQMNGTKTIP